MNSDGQDPRLRVIELDNTPVAPETARAAALYVCAKATDIEDAALLLDALGLL